MAIEATFKYLDSLSIPRSQTITVYSVRGFDDPDKISLWPPIIYDLADGSKRTAYIGFRRVVTFDCGIIQDLATHKFFLAFLNANMRSVYFYSAGVGGEEIFFVPPETEYEIEWIDNCKIGQKFVFPLTENVVRTSWSTYTPPSTVDILYIANHIEVTGTQTTPQYFQTNTAPLDHSGSGLAYPNISLISYAVTVIPNGAPYQDCKINLVGVPTQAGSNIGFYLALSDGGAPSGDGKFYCDIIIGLEAIVPP